MSPSNESVVDLSGQRLGDATQRLVDLARQAGYSVGATSPGTFQLARNRRRLLGSRTETVSVTIFEDRVGVKARVVGPVDAALVDNLRAGPQSSSPPASRSEPQAVVEVQVPTPPPVPLTPAAPPTASPAAPPSRGAPPAGGLIGSVPGGARGGVVHAASQMPAGIEEDDGRTVHRVREGAPQVSGVVLPDGRFVGADPPIVIGRNPDPSLGPPSAVAVAVDDPSLSKTHLAVSAGDHRLMVVDLHSTNGTSVEADGRSLRCEPGEGREVGSSDVIRAGNVVFGVRVA